MSENNDNDMDIETINKNKLFENIEKDLEETFKKIEIESKENDYDNDYGNLKLAHSSVTAITEEINNSAFISHPIFAITELNNKKKLIDWPKQTELCCYYDGEPFKTVPIPIPKGYDHLLKTYSVCMIFCSFSCALSHIREHVDSCDKPQTILQLRQMALEIFNFDKVISPAPDKYLLKKYCGKKGITIEQWRDNSQFATNIIRSPPFITYPMVFQELKTTKDMNIHMPIDFNTVKKSICEHKKSNYHFDSSSMRIKGKISKIDLEEKKRMENSRFCNYVNDKKNENTSFQNMTRIRINENPLRRSTRRRKTEVMDNPNNNERRGPLSEFLS